MVLNWPDGRTNTPPKPGVASSGFRSVSEYGYRWHPVFHDWRLHAGIDLIGLKDGRVKAVAAAKVTMAQYFGGYGNLVELTIQSGPYKGYRFRYGHNSKFLVKKDQMVVGGQDIAIWGMTGTATGVHVHFEVIPPGKSQINPRPFMVAANAGASGGGGTPIPGIEDIMAEATIIVERADSNKAKGVLDRKTGKIFRELNGAAESSVWRGVQSVQSTADLQVVFVQVTDANYAKLTA